MSTINTVVTSTNKIQAMLSDKDYNDLSYVMSKMNRNQTINDNVDIRLPNCGSRQARWLDNTTVVEGFESLYNSIDKAKYRHMAYEILLTQKAVKAIGQMSFMFNGGMNNGGSIFDTLAYYDIPTGTSMSALGVWNRVWNKLTNNCDTSDCKNNNGNSNHFSQEQIAPHLNLPNNQGCGVIRYKFNTCRANNYLVRGYIHNATCCRGGVVLSKEELELNKARV
tara:strand:+ start:5119 stop:5787 length:669 start_codon:yes stop_codon:yes gene_type:complete